MLNIKKWFSNQCDRGYAAETLASKYLKDHGLQLVTRNFLCRRGEIDLVMRDAETLVFVEVRFRKDSRFGTPQETVDANKIHKLQLAAQHYMQKHSVTSPVRFDVVAITGENRYTIDWIQNAF